MANAFQSDRFVISRCLGSGTFGAVYEVFDHERQCRVALKYPHEANAHNLYLFKKEFRALADINHRNLVQLHELISYATHWFFTMELVEGVDILHYLRSGASVRAQALGALTRDSAFCSSESGSNPTAESSDPDDQEEQLPASLPDGLPRLKNVFRQLAEGLSALHRAGLLHRDIKPSNVLVTSEERVVLLDYGLVAEIDTSARGPKDPSNLVGTPAYMAPEQFTDEHISEAADWYSLGVLLYHVLTGRLPFLGNGMRSLINKLSTTPLAPHELLPAIPMDLSQLCMDLLQPGPAERPTGAEVLDRLEGSALALLPLAGRRQYPFVARSREMMALLDAFRSLEKGQPIRIRLHGGSGMGKSFLVRCLKREIYQIAPQALILSGRCYEQEHVPYKALDSLVDALSHHLKQLPTAKVEALLPRHTYALAQLFPVLRQVPLIAEAQPRTTDSPDPHFLRRLAFRALRELLGRLSDTRPLVLIIDDIQWGDLDSTALLADLLRPPDPPVLLLITCFRTEEASTSPVIQDVMSEDVTFHGQSLELELKGLPIEQAKQLAGELLGKSLPDGEALAGRIAAESEGNPFFIDELAQHARGQSTGVSPTEKLEGYIAARIEALDPEPRQILEIVALAGYPMDWDVLKQAAQASAANHASLDQLRFAHLVRLRTSAHQKLVEPYHDWIRRTALARISPERARELHRRIAAIMESFPKKDAQALARHFQAAGEPRKAVEYATMAAQQALGTLAFDHAANLFRLSIQLRPPEDPDLPGLWRQLGKTLASAGRGADAAAAFLRAAENSSPRERLRLQRLAAEEFLRNGHFKRGVETLDTVLASIGARLSTTPSRSLLSALYHQLLARIRGVKIPDKPAEAIPQEWLDQLDIYWTATVGLASVDLLRVVDFQARQLALSLRAGEPVRLVRTLAYEALFRASRGNRASSAIQKYLEPSLVLAERIGHPAAMSHACVTSGIVDSMLGRWLSAATKLDKAITFLQDHCAGLTYELRSAQHHALLNHYVLGNFLEIERRLPLLTQEAEERGDLLFLANLKTGSAFAHHLAKNHPEAAREDIRRTMMKLPEEGFCLQKTMETFALADIAHYVGSPQEAWNLLQTRQDSLRRSGFMKVQLLRVTNLELQARSALALAAASPKERSRLCALATKDIRALQREHLGYGTALAQKLIAMKALIQGQTPEAQKQLFLAEVAFEACDMALHAAVMKRQRGLLKGPDGASLVQEAEAWMVSQGICRPDRMSAMHLPGLCH